MVVLVRIHNARAREHTHLHRDAEKFSKREDMHADNVHMIPAYYQQLAVILDNFFLAKVMN